MAPEDSAKKIAYEEEHMKENKAPLNDMLGEKLEDGQVMPKPKPGTCLHRKQHLASYLSSFFCWLLSAVWAGMTSIWLECSLMAKHRREHRVRMGRLRMMNRNDGLMTTVGDDGESLEDMMKRSLEAYIK